MAAEEAAAEEDVAVKKTKTAEAGEGDETIACKDCSADFIHSAADQEFFASKGWTCVAASMVIKRPGSALTRSPAFRVPPSRLSPDSNKPIRCRDCRNAKKAQAEGGQGGGQRERPAGNGCYNCGKDGHLSRDCPEPRKPREGGGGGGGMTCYNCQGEGHMSRDCPQPRQGGELKEPDWPCVSANRMI